MRVDVDEVRKGAAAVAAVVFVSLGIAACATGRGGSAPSETDDDPVLRISVRNQVVGGTSASVYVVPVERGGRELLGTVAPDTTESFSYRPTAALAERYRLLAKFTAGQELISNPFTAEQSLVVGWRLQQNSITVRTLSR